MQAVALGYPKISVIEFGVAGGRGLLNIEWHVQQIQKVLDVEIEAYGFDLESGLPKPLDHRDMPYAWAEGFFNMDREKLQSQLKLSKLVIGDIRETCSNFFQEFNAAPLGCVLMDLDYCSSTMDALKIFDTDANNYLPRVYCFFDDIFSGGQKAINEFLGEAYAISQFNESHPEKKITKITGLTAVRKVPAFWNEAAYAFHDFAHPRYCEYIGGTAEQAPL